MTAACCAGEYSLHADPSGRGPALSAAGRLNMKRVPVAICSTRFRVLVMITGISQAEAKTVSRW